MNNTRDHGGALDAAVARWGGRRGDWIDLSTGINPVPYPVGDLPPDVWTALPDKGATDRLIAAARAFWQVPDDRAILAAPGASALIAQLPGCLPSGPGARRVQIRPDTYNEHAAAFRASGWTVTHDPAPVRVIVHPNNPTGEFFSDHASPGTLILDESFCDTHPDHSQVQSGRLDTTILKSLGKFWGLAGLRVGFAIGDAGLIGRLATRLGPWAVSGPGLEIANRALSDHVWAAATRQRLQDDAARLDALMQKAGAESFQPGSGATNDCPLFRLYCLDDAESWHREFARHRILTRTFPYNPTWLRLGLPAPHHWPRLEAACGTVGGAMATPSARHRPAAKR